MTIRPFDPQLDYPALTALRNAQEPDYPVTEEELRVRDAMREAKLRHVRLVAEEDGTLIGFASGGNSGWSFHPQQFHLDVGVHPDQRRQGTGTALYEALKAALEPYEPIRFGAYIREDRPESLAFVQKYGDTEAMRAWESRLAVASVDLSRFEEQARLPESFGLRLTDFKTLEAEEGEEAYRKLYSMEKEVEQDVPRADGEVPSMPEYDHWRKTITQSVRYRPEAFFIAVAPDGTYVGISMLFQPQAGDYLDTGLTGVRRAWRRKGIAFALKLRAVAYARERGYAQIRTDNAQQNRAMLSINEALGFEKIPAWIEFVWTKPESATL